MDGLKKCVLCRINAQSYVSHTVSCLRTLILTVFAMAMVKAQAEQITWSLKGAWPGPAPEWHMSYVQVVSNLAFVSGTHWPYTNSRLTVLDLTNPTNPVPLSSYETELQIRTIRVSGHYAYLAEGNFQNVTNNPGVLEIVDVSNPTNLLCVASVTNLGIAHHLQVLGNLAYVAEGARWSGSNSLGALSIFDVSDPANPARIGHYATNGHFYDLHVDGQHAYVAGGNADLLVFDVSNPMSPVLVGNYSTNADNPYRGIPGGPAVDIDVLGSYVSAAGPDGLHVIDVSNPSAPIRIGGWTGQTLFMFRAVGNYAFAGESIPRGLQGPLYRWRIFDVSQPPAVTAFNREVRDTKWAVNDISIFEPYVYIASGTNGLLVFKMEPAQVPSPISVTRQDDVLSLSWEGAPGLILQRTSDFGEEDTEWIDVPGSEGQSRIELPLERDQLFFRLILPLL